MKINIRNFVIVCFFGSFCAFVFPNSLISIPLSFASGWILGAAMENGSIQKILIVNGTPLQFFPTDK